MNLPAEAWLVTSGEYSDYRVEGVYLDRALADQHAEMLGAEGRVTRWPVSAKPARKRILVERYYRIATGEEDTYEYPLVLPDGEPEPFEAFEDKPATPFGNIIVRGTDRTRVDKVYGERVARRRQVEVGP